VLKTSLAASLRTGCFSTQPRWRQFCSALRPSEIRYRLRAALTSQGRLPFRDSVKLLGVTLDSVLTMDRHVIRRCSYHTRALRHIRPLLALDVAKMIGHSIVSSRLDYANALLHGTSVYNINRLQVTQNSLVRKVCQALRSVPQSCVVSFTGCQFDSGFPTRLLSLPTRHVPPANLLTSLASCETTDQPEHYNYRTNCYRQSVCTSDGVSVLGESLQRQRPFSLEFAVISVSIC